MNPTMRRTGIKHATVRVEHHPSGGDVANILAFWWVNEDDDEPPRLTQHRVADIVRRYYYDRGEYGAAYEWDREFYGDEEAVRAWANGTVDRLWPDWRVRGGA